MMLHVQSAASTLRISSMLYAIANGCLNYGSPFPFSRENEFLSKSLVECLDFDIESRALLSYGGLERKRLTLVYPVPRKKILKKLL